MSEINRINIELNNIYNIDCLEGISHLRNNSIDLIILDPPYNINKSDWDKFKSIKDYITWLGTILWNCERILKNTGSLYIFHNDFLQIVEIQNWLNKYSNLLFKQFIVWNKKFNGVKHEEYLQSAILTNKNRNYRKMAEYCLFYTFKDITDLDYSHIANEVYKPVRNYFRDVMNKVNLQWKDEIIVNTFLENGCGKDYFNARQIAQNKLNTNYSQFRLISEKEYNFLNPLLHFDRSYNDIKLEWDRLNKIYREKKKKYKKENKDKLDKIRYTFNKQEKHSVWEYQTPQNKLHITQKPLEMIEDIINTSSNKNDIVLDCFVGSGTTPLACIKNNRNYIGFEIDKDFYDIALKRISNGGE